MKRTLIAAAVLSTMVTGAYAGERNCGSGCDPAELFTATNIYTDIGEFGFITLRGHVNVAASSGATVNNSQSVNIGGVDMQGPPQSYTKGNITTNVNTTHAWDNASGSGSSWSVSDSYKNDSYAYNNTHTSTSNWSKSGSFVKGGGFASGISANYGGYQYANTHQSANGFIAAGFIAGLGGGPGVIFGGVAAGFAGALNTHESSNFGGGFHGNASGYDVAWGGFAASGQSSATHTNSGSGSFTSNDYSAHAHAYGWNRNYAEDAGRVTVTGSVTEHIDTRKTTTMAATIDSGALAGAQGNIGVNMATGANNAQSNDAALANMDVGPVFGSAQIFSTQSSSGKAKVGPLNFVAAVGSGVLAGASGNVGVNVASGAGNVQNNSLAVSSTTVAKSDPRGWDEHSKSGNGGEVIASDQNCQTAEAGVKGSFTGSSYLGAGALAGATGNIGVNIASGVGNLQHNGLAVASVASH
ncbi:hypothetical protein [Paraburkholderia kururiensis]|jgi:hypothetical protein|uniref:hypothetical protein n=1 Tax=Paraburkholderia kururiensis TaxID=984307 RepID=UPI00034678C5|nr:hypothetical protein [Paraburkholderia kururiensis]